MSYALRTLEEPARSAIPALVQALIGDDGEVRRQAAACFRQFPGSESQFLTPLIKALNDPEIDVREEVADSLEGWAPIPGPRSRLSTLRLPRRVRRKFP